MNKRELLELIKDADDNSEVILTLTFPKPETGFTLGEDEAGSPAGDDSEDDEDDDENFVDNDDNTTTEFHPVASVEVSDYPNEETGAKEKVIFIALELSDEDGEDGDEDPEEGDSPED